MEEVPDGEIAGLDRAACDAQAMSNTRELGRLRNRLAMLSVEAVRVELEEERSRLLRDSPEASNARIAEIQRTLRSLNDPTQPEVAGRAVEELRVNLERQTQFRIARAGRLIRRRNELIQQKQKADEDAKEKLRQEIPRRLWGEQIDTRRLELLGLSVRLLEEVERAVRAGQQAEPSYEVTALSGLARKLRIVVDVLQRVPRLTAAGGEGATVQGSPPGQVPIPPRDR